MKNWWLKFGCFLTGYNYQIVIQSSEMSAKSVKKYTAALLIICILWGFIGYAFTQRYGQTGFIGSIVGALISIIIVIQIERQIILTIGNNYLGRVFRIFIGIIMACIGSVIIDQIIFKDDVEKRQLTINQVLVDSLLPKKTFELNNHIKGMDSLISNKEGERTALQKELYLKPTISLASSAISYEKDTLTGKFIPASRSNSSKSMVNPKAALMQPLLQQIDTYVKRKSEMENRMVTIREDVEKQVASKTGFLDELDILFKILFESKVALIMWVLWFCLLLFIELFVLVSKYGDVTDDYMKTVIHQMEVKIEMLEKLRRKPDVN